MPTALAVLALVACDSGDPVWNAPRAKEIDAGDPAMSGPGELPSQEPGEAESAEVPEPAVEEPEPDPPEPFCTAYEAAIQTGSLPAGLAEVSGLVASVQNPGVLWMIEDGGNEADVYAVTPAGALAGVVHVAGVPNVDWEDLALAPCGEETCLWVADIGDNAFQRGEVTLYRIREPIFDGQYESEQEPEVFPFAYPSGAQNAESLVVTGEGRPYVLTKRDDASTYVYAIDAVEPGTRTEARALGALSTASDTDTWGSRTSATGAALWPDEGRLYVRTYGAAWSWQLGEAGMEGVAEGARAEVPATAEPQGEAIAWDADEAGFWQVSEGEGSALWFTGCTVSE